MADALVTPNLALFDVSTLSRTEVLRSSVSSFNEMCRTVFGAEDDSVTGPIKTRAKTIILRMPFAFCAKLIIFEFRDTACYKSISTVERILISRFNSN